jgi:hypothetical protein
MRNDITNDTPLRLADALKIAFPMGGMTLSGLRKEVARGRLAVEVIAGKQFTTLAAIEEMRRLCRENPKVRVLNSARRAATSAVESLIAPPGESETDQGISAQDALSLKLLRLNKP